MSARKRVGASMTCEQAKALNAVLTALELGKDVKVIMRSAAYHGARKVVSSVAARSDLQNHERKPKRYVFDEIGRVLPVGARGAALTVREAALRWKLTEAQVRSRVQEKIPLSRAMRASPRKSCDASKGRAA